MARYRPPSPVSSPYISAAGYAMLEKEVQSLWLRRSSVTLALAAAAAEGDRSENAEYIYRKKELREIDRRIRYLQKRLPALTVVSKAPADADSIFFGAEVALENHEGIESTYRIVGSDEFEPAKGWISIDSPLARALLKKQAGDEIRVDTPGGPVLYWITGIRYPEHES
ncbi:MAG: transcription elongation factor GreB [Methylococcaceae bacterium]|nr:transcription elongation factor GreB [Methylococcaceae bacterium]MCI0733953.1 transcription elongation factor GreB [Methylococcaceae bacterium]